VKTRFQYLPGEHLTGDSVGAPFALSFLEGRFDGQPPSTDC